jgi:hypothetical protein
MGDLVNIELVEYEVNWSVAGVRQILARMGRFGFRLPARWFLKNLPKMDNIDLIVSAGGATQWANAAIAKQERLRNVFLGSLRSMNADAFTLAASHDAPLDHERLYRFEIIPSQFTPDSFSEEAKKMDFAYMEIWGLMIGGDGEGYHWSAEDYVKLCNDFLSQAKEVGVGVWVATSRRTPAEIEAKMIKLIEESGRSVANSYCHDKDDSTKALGLMMAVCSRLCVTADSMSMTHEAISTGTPVVVISPEIGGTARLKANLHDLKSKGFLDLKTLGSVKIADAEPVVGWKSLMGDPSKPLAEKVLNLFNQK